MTSDLSRWPVIVGVGESRQRSKDLNHAKEPLALMTDALKAAQQDAGVDLWRAVDGLYVIRQVSWPSDDTPHRLAKQLGMSAKHPVHGPIGGETPIRFLHEGARAIWHGECQAVAVVGAEAQYSVNAARALGHHLPWSACDPHSDPLRGGDHQHPLAKTLGVATPATAYPLFEHAAHAHWDLTPAQAHAESAQLWSHLSQVAAQNPSAWNTQAWRPSDVAEVGPHNRPIAWPYPLRMVANPAVNMGAAFILTSRGQALAWGIPTERMVHVMMGAHASDPINYLERDDLGRSPGQEVVLDAARAYAAPASSAPNWSAIELYSCFPVVPKLARRRLALSPAAPISCTGGLSFFGAPLNNYMSHAVCAMVRQMRTQPSGLGLLFGQGGYMTKHHAVILGHAPGDPGIWDHDGNLQALADRARGAAPVLDMAYTGEALVESHTVLFDRESQVRHGVVVLRSPQGARLLARVAANDHASLDCLMSAHTSAVGALGSVSTSTDGVPEWRVTPTHAGRGAATTPSD